MNGFGWALVGAGAVSLVGLICFLAAEREFREAAAQVFGALVAGPALLIAIYVRTRGPRLMRLSPGGLERFSRQLGPGMKPAWALTYRGKGVILVRRAEGHDWINDVPNRMNRSREGR